MRPISIANDKPLILHFRAVPVGFTEQLTLACRHRNEVVRVSRKLVDTPVFACCAMLIYSSK